MTFPTPHTVGWHTASTVQSGRGTVTTLTPERDQPGTAVRVYGWAPTREFETSETRVESDLDLFVPAAVTSSPGDVVDLPLDKSFGTFEVVAHAQDWSHGPFGFAPGSVVKLKRVQG